MPATATRKEKYSFTNQGPSPKVGDKRITKPERIKSARVIVIRTTRDWVHYQYVGAKNPRHVCKMRRYLWNNLRRSHK